MAQGKANVVVSLLLLTATLAATADEPPKVEKERPPRLDRYGDPLPAGAIARIGSIRFRIPSNVNSLSYSLDGKTLAAIGHNCIRLWDAATGKLLHSYDFLPPTIRRSFPRMAGDCGCKLQGGRRIPLEGKSTIGS